MAEKDLELAEGNLPGLQAALRRFGLSRYEAAVYLGLVQDQTARVAEISRRTGVPPPKVYQALDSLVEKGFCSVGSNAVNRYRPLPPREALDQHIERLRQEAAAARDLAQELEALHASGAGRELWAPPVEIVKGLAQVRRLLVEGIQGAREEICFFGKAPQFSALEVAEALWERGRSGVRLRMIFEAGYFEGGEEQKAEDDLYRRMPGEKRETRDLPTKMLIIDDALALLSIPRPGSEGYLTLILRQPGLVRHCRASFEHSWASAATA